LLRVPRSARRHQQRQRQPLRIGSNTQHLHSATRCLDASARVRTHPSYTFGSLPNSWQAVARVRFCQHPHHLLPSPTTSISYVRNALSAVLCAAMLCAIRFIQCILNCAIFVVLCNLCDLCCALCTVSFFCAQSCTFAHGNLCCCTS
jgi:hypothetical protein